MFSGCLSNKQLTAHNGDRLSFYLSALLLAAFSLVPVWGLRFLPMQDYPHHLFISYVMSSFQNPLFNWEQYYQVSPKLAPYSLFYSFIKYLSMMTGIETAGKLFVSLYIVTVCVLIFRASRDLPREHVPWGLLMLFPFAFHQMYFLGFTNYILSVPLLFLALLDFRRLIDSRLSPLSLLRHAPFQLLLFINHPYTIMLYVLFAGIMSLLSATGFRGFIRNMISPMSIALLFALWLIISGQMETSTAVRWWPISGTMQFLLLMFTGMKITDGADWFSLSAWLIAASIFFFYGAVRRRYLPVQKDLIMMTALCLIGAFALPFLFKTAQYFNARLAPVIYIFIALILSRIVLTKRAGYVIAVLMTFLLFRSFQIQRAVATETTDILPVIFQMQRNAAVLPIMFDSSSSALDRAFFYQTHDHEVFYYHILIGGGANPQMYQNASSPNSIFPLAYRQGVYLPKANSANFRWQEYEPYYKYVLTRGAPEELTKYMQQRTLYLGKSGKWELFQRKF